MWTADKWSDYELIDSSDGERLERWGSYTLIRPDPQVIWKDAKKIKALAQCRRFISPFVKGRRQLGKKSPA